MAASNAVDAFLSMNLKSDLHDSGRSTAYVGLTTFHTGNSIEPILWTTLMDPHGSPVHQWLHGFDTRYWT